MFSPEKNSSNVVDCDNLYVHKACVDVDENGINDATGEGNQSNILFESVILFVL